MTRLRYLTIAAAYVASAALYPKLPAQTPSFWKSELPVWRPLIAFLLPTAAVVISVLFVHLLTRDMRQVGTTFSAVYQAIVSWIVLFIIGLHFIVLSGLLGRHGLAARGSVVLLGVVVVGVGNLLPRTRPNVVIGIRTVRILTNRSLWMRMHRLVGYTAVGLGMTIALSAFLPHWQRVYAISTAALIAGCVAVIYYRKYSRA